MDHTTRDLIHGLLNPNPKARLNADRLMDHAYFETLDWNAWPNWNTPKWPDEGDFPAGWNYENSLFS